MQFNVSIQPVEIQSDKKKISAERKVVSKLVDRSKCTAANFIEQLRMKHRHGHQTKNVRSLLSRLKQDKTWFFKV